MYRESQSLSKEKEEGRAIEEKAEEKTEEETKENTEELELIDLENFDEKTQEDAQDKNETV